MEVFRISKQAFSHQLTSSGVANRWNNDNEFVIYTASSRALATLEFLVHLNLVKPSFTCKTLVIDIPETSEFIDVIRKEDLPDDWREIDSYPALQTIGSEWYRNNHSPVLKVPSAIIPQEFNYIINTRHPQFNEIDLADTEDYFWDIRLFTT